MNQKLTQRQRELARALKRLSEPQGAVARRNARKATFKALGDIRREVEASYPVERRKPRVKPPATVGERKRRLRKAGWAPLDVKMVREHDEAVEKAATVGIRIRRVEGAVWVPAWFAKHWHRPAGTLERFKKNPAARRAAEVEAELGKDGD